MAEACVHVCPRNPAKFDVDNVRTAKILGGGLSETSVLHGMVVMRHVEGHVRRADDPKVAVFSCPIEASTGETKANVVISSPEELKQFSKGEEDLLNNAIKALHESGVTVVIANGSISDMALHFLDNYNIMVVRTMSKFELKRICRTLGAVALPRLSSPTEEEMGRCKSIYSTEIGERKLVKIEQ